jgi:outer membrane protein assembly factor BamB
MFTISTRVRRWALLTTALATAASAQMVGTGGVMGGMGAMAFGPAVGPDGTAYVLRQTVVAGMMGSQSAVKNELVAINPSNGAVNWALQIDGTMTSAPVLAKDGTILLTLSEPGMMTGTAASTPALLIVASTATSARVQARVPVDSDVLSQPVTTPDGQTIYVVGTDMPSTPMRGQGASTGTTFLYAFFPGTGSLKFKVQLR